eukprot:764604-Hanusia_phi.AAC.1
MEEAITRRRGRAPMGARAGRRSQVESMVRPHLVATVTVSQRPSLRVSLTSVPPGRGAGARARASRLLSSNQPGQPGRKGAKPGHQALIMLSATPPGRAGAARGGGD